MAQRGNSLIFTFVGQDRFSQVAGAVSNKIGKFGKLAGIAAAGIGVFAAQGAKAFIEFDDRMNESLAIMGEVSGPMKQRMVAAANAVGTSTRFSAGEAADAYFFLASAGFDAEQSLRGMPIVADFAQAGLIDMATGSELLVDALNALGLRTGNTTQDMKNMTRVSDVLTQANVVSNATIEEMAEALTNKAAPAMRVMGIEVEEGTAVLAAMASQGIKGRRAGLGLAIVLRELSRRAITHAEAFKRANIQVFDAQGNMNNLGVIVGQLEKRFKGMSDEQLRSELMMLGFTDRSIQFILNLIGMSKQIKTYERDLRSAGGVTEQISENQMKSFAARLDVVKAHIEELARSMGKGLVIALFNIGEHIAEMVRVFQRLPGPIKAAAAALVALLPAVAIIRGIKNASILAGVKILELADNFRRMGTAARIAHLSLGVLGVALAAATTALALIANKNLEAEQRVDQYTQSLNKNTGALTKNTRQIAINELEKAGALKAAESLGLNTAELTDAVLGNEKAQRKVNTVLDRYKIAGSEAAVSAGILGNATGKATAKSRAQERAANLVREALGQQTGALAKAREETLRKARANQRANNSEFALNVMSRTLTQTMKKKTVSIDDVIKSMNELTETLLNARSSSRAWHQSIDDARRALKQNGATLDRHTQKGRDNEAALDDIVVSTLEHAKSMREDGKSLKQITGFVDRSRKAFIRLATQFTGNRKRARQLADELGLTSAQFGRLNRNTDANSNKTRNNTNRTNQNTRASRGQSAALQAADQKLVNLGRELDRTSGSTRNLERRTNSGRAEFRRQHGQMHKNQNKAGGLKRQLDRIPGRYTATAVFNDSKATRKLEAFRRKLIKIDGKTVKATALFGSAFAGGRGGFSGGNFSSAGHGRVLPPGSYSIGRGSSSHGYNARDLPAPTGTPVFAPFNGIARGRSVRGSYGNHVRLSGPGGNFLAAHLSRFGNLGFVKRGQIIGFVGSTGNSTGPHLHIEPDIGAWYEKGGFAKRGQVAVVGERGPELVQFEQPARVYSNQQSKRMMDDQVDHHTDNHRDRPINIEHVHVNAVGGQLSWNKIQKDLKYRGLV